MDTARQKNVTLNTVPSGNLIFGSGTVTKMLLNWNQIITKQSSLNICWTNCECDQFYVISHRL